MNILHPATGEKVQTLPDALYLLTSAREAYDAAHTAAQQARRAETAALNDLNKAQRAVDAALASIKMDAPWDSDWHNKAKRCATGAA